MNLRKMIVELEQERNRLDEAILALERLSRSIAKRPGRSPRWAKEVAAAASSYGGSKSTSLADGSGEKPPLS
jgi:hypothetical protein